MVKKGTLKVFSERTQECQNASANEPITFFAWVKVGFEFAIKDRAVGKEGWRAGGDRNGGGGVEGKRRVLPISVTPGHVLSSYLVGGFMG